MPRREVTGATLVGVAAGLVAERGVAGAHLVAVAQAAGVSVGTVYNRFPDKAALLAAVAEQVERDVVDVMAAAAPRSRALRPALPDLAGAVLRTVLGSPASRVLVEQERRGAAATSRGRLVRGWIADRVRAAQASGEVGAVDPQLVAALAFAIVLAAAQELQARDEPRQRQGAGSRADGGVPPLEDVSALVGASLAALLPAARPGAVAVSPARS